MLNKITLGLTEVSASPKGPKAPKTDTHRQQTVTHKPFPTTRTERAPTLLTDKTRQLGSSPIGPAQATETVRHQTLPKVLA